MLEQSDKTQLALMAQSIASIEKSLADINRKIEKIDGNLVIKSEFNKLERRVDHNESNSIELRREVDIIKNDVALNKKIIYGSIAVVLTTILVALLALIVIPA